MDTISSQFFKVKWKEFLFHGKIYCRYETSDGISRKEKAVLNNIGTDNEALSVQGEYSYIGDDGQTYKLTFVADENGFRPASDYLPEGV